MSSKFTYSAYFHFLWVVFIPIVVCINLSGEQEFNQRTFYIIPILLVLSLYGVFNVYRTKAISVIIDDKALRVRRFCGWGSESVYQLKDLDGYAASKVSGRHSKFDYIYIVYKNKRVAKISNQYHSNFDDLSQKVFYSLQGLGFRPSSFLTEIQDSFTY